MSYALKKFYSGREQKGKKFTEENITGKVPDA